MNTKKKREMVFTAKSYEEACRIERSREAVTIKSLLTRLFITLWVFFANLLLRGLRLLFLPSRLSRNDEIRNVVIYTVGTLGDNVLMLPSVAAVKRRYAQAHLTVITNCDHFSEYPARAIYSALPYVDKFIPLLDHPVQKKGFKILVNFPDDSSFKCDLFVNLSPFGNRGWFGAVIREMIFAKHLKAKRALGFKMATYNRKGMFNAVQHHFVKNEARRTSEVLKEMGVAPLYGEDLLNKDDKARQKVLTMLSPYLNSSHPLIVLNPGAKLKASQWPPERFGALAQWFTKHYDACVILNGTAAEKDICSQVVQASGGTAISLAGDLNVQELIELLRMASACITNNTGPMTLTALLGVATVVISSTRFSPAFYMPVSDKMIWLFSFNTGSYSYKDIGGPSDDMLFVQLSDVKKAVEEIGFVNLSSSVI